MAAGNAGSYFVRLTNIIGQADSRTASIGYSADTTSPTIFQALGGHVSTRVFVAFSEPVNVGLPGGARQRLRTLVDDGAIFYLNGQEVLRLRTPNGPVDCATFANVSQGDAANIFEGPYELPAAALIGGTNVFAVEVHQANAASSDVSFAAQLFLDLPVLSFPSPALTALRDTGGATLLWSNAAVERIGIPATCPPT